MLQNIISSECHELKKFILLQVYILRAYVAELLRLNLLTQ